MNDIPWGTVICFSTLVACGALLLIENARAQRLLCVKLQELTTKLNALDKHVTQEITALQVNYDAHIRQKNSQTPLYHRRSSDQDWLVDSDLNIKRPD